MSSNDEYLTDDFVAELLANEAKDASLKYSAMGVDAFKASRRPATKLKPNTRFLQNLLKGTESHNTALLAREAAESQARLQQLSDAENARRRRYKPEPTDIRKRQLGNIKSILGGMPPKRTGDTPEAPTDQHSKDEPEQDGRRAPRDSIGDRTCSETEPTRKREREREDDDDDDGDTNRQRTRRQRHKRHRLNSEDESHHRHRRTKGRSRSRSPKMEHRIKSPVEEYNRRSKEHHRHPARDRERRQHRDRGTEGDRERGGSDDRRERKSSAKELLPKKATSSEDSDSDMIGPVPPPKSPVRRRGRGSAASTSGIDRRFSASYDPKADVDAAPGQDNWDQAAGAFRDRLKWQERGASRLRKAGVSDPDIRKWENGGEKRLEDMRWTRKGEKREWDRGKVVGPDGSVSVAADWAHEGAVAEQGYRA